LDAEPVHGVPPDRVERPQLLRRVRVEAERAQRAALRRPEEGRLELESAAVDRGRLAEDELGAGRLRPAAAMRHAHARRQNAREM
jgi:hypothetical protein